MTTRLRSASLALGPGPRGRSSRACRPSFGLAGPQFGPVPIPPPPLSAKLRPLSCAGGFPRELPRQQEPRQRQRERRRLSTAPLPLLMPQARNRLKPVQTGRFHLGLVFSPWRRGAFGNLRPPPSERSHWSRAMAPRERPARSLGVRHVTSSSAAEGSGEQSAEEGGLERGDPPPPRQRARSAKGKAAARWVAETSYHSEAGPPSSSQMAGVGPALFLLASTSVRCARLLGSSVVARGALGALCCRWLLARTVLIERGAGGDAGLCCTVMLYFTAALALGRWVAKWLKLAGEALSPAGGKGRLWSPGCVVEDWVMLCFQQAHVLRLELGSAVCPARHPLRSHPCDADLKRRLGSCGFWEVLYCP